MAIRDPYHDISYLQFAPLTAAVPWARQHATAALQAWQLPPETIATIETFVSELVTSAIDAFERGYMRSGCRKHGDAEWVALTLCLLPDKVAIEVLVHDPRPPISAKTDPDAKSGRAPFWSRHWRRSRANTFHSRAPERSSPSSRRNQRMNQTARCLQDRAEVSTESEQAQAR